MKSFTDTFFYQSANKDFPTLEQNQWEEQQEDARGDGVQAEQLHEHDYVHAQPAINEHQCLLLHHPHRSHQHLRCGHSAPCTENTPRMTTFLLPREVNDVVDNDTAAQHVNTSTRRRERQTEKKKVDSDHRQL